MVFRNLIFNQITLLLSFAVEEYRSSLKEIKKANLFLLLLKKQNMCSQKILRSTIRILKWYEDFFGKEMWKHVITEATYHQHFLQNKVGKYFGEFLELVILFKKQSGRCVLLRFRLMKCVKVVGHEGYKTQAKLI